jgi:anti-sigma regulatory factor (Ser/Thr protein kinase)
MVNVPFHSYKIEERSYVAFVKREIHNLVAPVFSEVRTGEIDIVVAELTSNLVKYAGSGELLYRLSFFRDEPLFELICIDSGPGMENVSHSRRDGVTTGSSLGQGMGSVTRMANLAQFYSLPDWGTVVYVRFRKELDFREPSAPLVFRCLNVPLAGETLSGDIAALRIGNRRSSFMVADGLGHGANANEAASLAAECFLTTVHSDPSVVLREMNNAIRKTRGAVATVVNADIESRRWEICGIGNINVRIYHGLEHKAYITNNGIIGMTLPNRLENLVIPMEKLQQVLLSSDGIRTKWTLLKYPGILKYDPMILAAALYKDEGRGTDDTIIAIIKVA